MMVRLRLKHVLFILPLVFGISCLEEPECTQLDNDSVNLRFLSKLDGKLFPVFIDSVYLPQADYTVIKNATVSQVLVPLAPEQPYTQIVIHGEMGKDTLWISYSYIPKLFGKPCEVELLYSNQKIMQSSLDSLRLDLLTLPPNANIYY